MKHNYQQTMDRLRFHSDFVQNTIATIQEKEPTTKHFSRKPMLTVVAAFTCLAIFMAGILRWPGNTGNTAPLRQDNAIAVSPANSVTAYVSLPSNHHAAMILPCSALALQKEENSLPTSPVIRLPVIVFEDEKVTSLAGIDLMITGDDLSSITFTSKHNLFLHEDSRNWTVEDGTATWSEYRMFLTDDRVPTQPTREEIIDALSAMQFSGRENDTVVIRQFISHLYAEELSRMAAQGGNIDTFLNEKMLEPILFSQYDITFYHTDDSDKGCMTESGWTILLNNPVNLPIPPLESRSITVRPGEYVTWNFADAAQLLGLQRQSSEILTLSDEITITATYQNGQSKEQIWSISFDWEGYLILSERNESLACDGSKAVTCFLFFV